MEREQMPTPGQNLEEVKKIEEIASDIYKMAELIASSMKHFATLPDNELADIVISFKEPLSSMAWETLTHRKDAQNALGRIIHSNENGVPTRESEWEGDWKFDTVSIPEKHRRASAE